MKQILANVYPLFLLICNPSIVFTIDSAHLRYSSKLTSQLKLQTKDRQPVIRILKKKILPAEDRGKRHNAQKLQFDCLFHVLLQNERIVYVLIFHHAAGFKCNKKV